MLTGISNNISIVNTAIKIEPNQVCASIGHVTVQSCLLIIF